MGIIGGVLQSARGARGCQMATLSIGSAQTSARVCPVQPSSQGRFAGSWSRLSLEFPALGAEGGWLGTPFPSDPSNLVPSAPRPLRSRRREPGCDPWFGFNISYFWPSSILMAHADRMGSTRKDVAASRYLEIKGSSARRSSNLDDAVSPRLPQHPLRPNSQSGGLIPWYSSYRNTCMASPQAKSSNMPRQAIGPAVCEEVVS